MWSAPRFRRRQAYGAIQQGRTTPELTHTMAVLKVLTNTLVVRGSRAAVSSLLS